ncbi:MAG TPA: hypothetical protein GX513_04270, partial [Firmicutes bacterium]|nr:hypothetical protein [Bacillota bacterium]
MDWRDVLALTVGGVIGADVYVASTFAGDLGPAFLVLWVGGALLAL